MDDIRPADAAINHLKRHYTPGAERPSEDPETTEALQLDVDLTWPPPGLAHLHGLLNRVTGSLLVAAFVLIATIALPLWIDRPAELGSWGTVIAFIICGVLLWGAYMWLLVLFNRAASGVEAGFPRQLVWLVAADSQRNTFDILRGAGPYERLASDQRRALLDARVTASLLGLAGALWLTISLPLLLVFGAAAGFSVKLFWATALLPTIVLLAFSVYHRMVDARADFGSRIPDEDARVVTQQAGGWRELFEHSGYRPDTRRKTARYRIGAAIAFVAVFLMLLPLGMAIFTTFVPRLLQGNTGLYTHSVRIAALAPLRAYSVPIDSVVLRLSPRDFDGKSEQELREMISAGFVIADDSISTLDAMYGALMVQFAGSALAKVLRADGRAVDAQYINGVLEASAHAGSAAFQLGVRSRLNQVALRRITLNQTLPRAYRWQAFRYASWSARCGTLTSLAFGPRQDYRDFVNAAREALVRNSAEQTHFNTIVGDGRCSLEWVRNAVGMRR